MKNDGCFVFLFSFFSLIQTSDSECWNRIIESDNASNRIEQCQWIGKNRITVGNTMADVDRMVVGDNQMTPSSSSSMSRLCIDSVHGP